MDLSIEEGKIYGLIGRNGVGIAIVCISIFAGALLHRFGKAAFWILWAVYMAGVLTMNVNWSQAGIVGEAVTALQLYLKSLTSIGLLTVGILLCTILTAVGTMIFRKSPVR